MDAHLEDTVERVAANMSFDKQTDMGHMELNVKLEASVDATEHINSNKINQFDTSAVEDTVKQTTNILDNDLPKTALFVPQQVATSLKVRRMTWRTLVQIMLMLNKALAAVAPSKIGELEYWRNLALSRGTDIERSLKVIELQRTRIEILENDLRSLISLGRETQEMLAEITKQPKEQLMDYVAKGKPNES